MADRLKELLNKILEWWNKFSAKQKTFIISAGAGIILALAVLVTIFTRPRYVLLLNCDSQKQAAEVTELLDGEGLNYTISDDAYQIRIKKEQQAKASMLLAQNDIQSSTYTIDNVTEGGFSTTEADKQRRYEVYLQERMANDILTVFEQVKHAVVEYHIPEQNGTLIASKEDSFITIVLTLKEEMSSETAAGIAKLASIAMGNKTTENVVIMDSLGNTLYCGDDDYSASGTASSQLSVKSQMETKVKSEVRQVLLGTNEFDRVEVAANLVVDFSSSKVREHEYYVEGDNTQGYLSSSRTFSSSAENGNGEVPGTDANGEPEYVYQDSGSSSSETEEEELKYLPNERIVDKDVSPGVVDYSQSSISLAATTLNLVREEDVRAQGFLDGGVTWDEYKLANAGRTQIEVSDDLYNVVSKATGFPVGNIAIVAYSENVFIDRERLNISGSDIMQIVLIVIILALLAFVVLRSMRSDRQSDQPEELSVETLLQSQPDLELEDIGVETISETRRLIEKFVDENPEAVANLLRNWLNEE